MKIGLIRCMQTEDMCPATVCLSVMNNKKMAFSNINDPIEVVGLSSCGGCPGKKAVTRAQLMAKNGAQAIALSSCISKGSPVDMACPHFAAMKQAIQKRLGPEIAIFDYTHD